MVLRLYRANRVENLLEQLVGILAQPLGDPMAAEVVMVQNPGMATWLGRNLADRFGICAGVEFLFPRKVIGRAFSAVLGEEAFQVHAFEPARLTWTILARLPELLGQAEFAPLRRYLRHDSGDRKRIQLARRIADVFDQYALYRPEMVSAWEAGAEGDWQAHLWRAVANRLGTGHVASLTRRFTEKMAGLAGSDKIPRRLCCFGISTLPPLYVHVLELLSRHLEMHFFLLQPTAEYFADIRSRGEIDRILARRENSSPESLALEEGHPLLASMGRMGREFQQLLLEHSQFHDVNLFTNPEGNHMLAVLQHDMLHLLRRNKDPQHGPVLLDPHDHSISIHSCHGPMREVEVLRDQLLALFDADPSLLPGDIVVMMPNVETYAPLIEATFGESGRKYLPFSIADRTFRGASPAIDAFFRVLDLHQSRTAASEVMDLLSLPAVHRRFNIAADELETLADWVVNGGIRWGMDAVHRASFDQPKAHQNTWRFGLERLLLGYALPSENELFHDVSPRDQVEGIEARLLGRFSHFSSALFGFLNQLRGKRTVEGWQKLLLRLLDAMVAADGENEWQHSQIRAALDNLVVEAHEGGFSESLELVALRGLLEDRIEYENEGWNFLAEGITFCAMVPMRSIPFRIVAMMGLDDNAFPRSRRPENFDKIAEKPRPGDRAKRNEERYLFLEALLAARERVIITYVGQDIKDNAAIPPSVVVSELIDCLSESHRLPETRVGDRPAMEARLVVRHPMQGFNPLYFDPHTRSELFSYSDTHFQGAQGYVAPHGHAAPLFSKAFPPAETTPRLSLESLIQFFAKPMAYLMKNRLGFTLSERERVLSDREPLDLVGLDKFRVGNDLLERRVDGMDEAQSRHLAEAEGYLPLGTPGKVVYQALADELSPLLHALKDFQGRQLPPLDVSLPLGDTLLYGRLRHRYPQGQLWYQYKRLSGKQMLKAWIYHLALCAGAPTDQEAHGFWLGRGPENAIVRAHFTPVAEAATHLHDLVRLYHIGCAEPLLFFPKAAWAFARADDDGKAHKAARKAWREGDFAEVAEPHYTRAFGDSDVLSPGFSLFEQPMVGGDFPTLARRVFAPMLGHLEQEVHGAPV